MDEKNSFEIPTCCYKVFVIQFKWTYSFFKKYFPSLKETFTCSLGQINFADVVRASRDVLYD